MSSVRTFVISLPQDVARRQPLLAQLRELDIEHKVFDAVYGASLSNSALAAAYDPAKAVHTFNRELGKGEIGCALSHIGIYREMEAGGVSHALILEDDATILDSQLPRVLARLEQTFPADVPVVVLLNYVRRYVANRAIELDTGRKACRLYRARGAHGYFLTRAAAGLLARGLYPTYAAADRWEHMQKRFGIDIKVLVPYCIGLTNASRDSRIEAVDRRSTRSNRIAMKYHLGRHFEQLRYFTFVRPFLRVGYQQHLENDLVRHYGG
ncbi:MAG: glycosyltransferase family 25 protein [Burkholderiaceae bacterium]